MSRDLAIMVVGLLFALVLPTQVRAEGLDLRQCLIDRAERTERLAGCLEERTVLEDQVDRFEVVVPKLVAKLDKSERRVRNQRLAGLLVGIGVGVAGTAGAVTLAGRLR